MKNDGSPQPQNLWKTLESRAKEERPLASDLWRTLRQKLEFSNLKPEGISTVEVSQQKIRGEEYYVLHNTKKDTYIQLDSRGFFVWKLMDGRHSLTDICVAYLLEFGLPPFEQITELMAQLKSKDFLEETPPSLYGLLWGRFAGQRLRYRLAKLWKIVSSFQVTINADDYFGRIYRYGGRFLFTRTAKMFFLALSAAGIVLFVWLLFQGTYRIGYVAGSYTWGIITLYIISWSLYIVHEHAHGLSCKSYGRKVLSGGFTFYWGQPCLFVDTTDMWLASRNGRMMVAWAGPWSIILVAALSTVIIVFLPSSAISPLLFQVAFMGFFNAVVNMNPLLEWDGYYVLINFLEIPRLRAKSFDFIKGPLWHKLSVRRSKFSREEMIFIIFGVMASIWGIVAVLLAVRAWQSGIFSLLKSFWDSNWLGAKIILAIIGFSTIVPLVGSTGLKIWQGLRDVWNLVFGIRGQHV